MLNWYTCHGLVKLLSYCSSKHFKDLPQPLKDKFYIPTFKDVKLATTGFSSFALISF